MSTFKFIALRDVPHEICITIGGGVKLSRTKWEKIVNLVYPRSTDLELFFGLDKRWEDMTKRGVTFTVHRHFDDINTTWEEIAAKLELMPSKSQARKNGWTGSIPSGYSEMKRKNTKFFILKLDTDMTREDLLNELTKTYLPGTCKE